MRRGNQFLKKIQREAGITFVFVTHDQEEAMRMSDRIAVFNEGRVEQIGTPEQVYEAPKTKFESFLSFYIQLFWLYLKLLY